MASISQLPISEFMSASIFSKKGVSYFAANKYVDSFESMSSMGNVMEGILSSNAEGTTSGIAQLFSDFMVNVRAVAVGPLKTIGIALALLFLIMALFQLGMEDRLNPEIFVKHFGKFGLSMIAIAYSDVLIDYIMQFGNALTDWAGTLTLGIGEDGTVPTKVELCNLFFSGINAGVATTWNLFFDTLMNGAIVGLASIALTIVSLVIAFSRMLELSIRAIGMPIAMGMLADDGWRGAGGRYIKKFIAVCSQGFVLILIAKVTTGIMTQSFTSLTTQMTACISAESGNLTSLMMQSILVSLGVGVASITVMHKSMGLVNDMFGA